MSNPKTLNPRQARYELIEHDGQKMTLEKWSVVRKIKPMTLYTRLYQLGWSVEKALTQPTRHYRRLQVQFDQRSNRRSGIW